MSITWKNRNKKTVVQLLEQGTPHSIKAAKENTEKLIRYHWDFYYELAAQRNQYHSQLLEAVRKSVKTNLEIKNWQRALAYRYSLHPLCTKGSIAFIGGRFNAGEDINAEISNSNALYLAVDKDTALKEHLSQSATNNLLSARENALTTPNSETIVSISGNLDSYIDLSDETSLNYVIEIIKNFTISKRLTDLAKELGSETPTVVKSAKALHASLLAPNWAVAPSNYDVPANSQIFGSLVREAGIQGILYPSKFTSKNCLAIFPENLQGTDAYISLDGELPLDNILRELNKHTWKMSELSYDEINQVRSSDRVN